MVSVENAIGGVIRGVALALGLIAFGASEAAAQEPTSSIIIVDNERVLRESDVARRLAVIESAARAELQAKLNELTIDVEREEAELTTLREQLDKTEFDERVRAFNEKVQTARRTFQQENEALQRQFVRARQRVAEALPQVLSTMLADTGAEIVVDSRFVLAAKPDIDMSAEAIERFNVATAGLFTGPTLEGADE